MTRESGKSVWAAWHGDDDDDDCMSVCVYVFAVCMTNSLTCIATFGEEWFILHCLFHQVIYKHVCLFSLNKVIIPVYMYFRLKEIEYVHCAHSTFICYIIKLLKTKSFNRTKVDLFKLLCVQIFKCRSHKCTTVKVTYKTIISKGLEVINLEFKWNQAGKLLNQQ